MNSIVTLPIVAALPVAAPAMTSITAADHSALDTDLIQAAYDLQATDQAIRELRKQFGDDADSREDYLALEDRRNETIGALVTVPAKSMAGIQAKAVCVRLRTLVEDYGQHQQVAVSLADDLIQLGYQAVIQPMLEPADADTIAAAEKFEPLLLKYVPVQLEWAKLSRAALAEAFDRFGDDYGSDDWSKPLAGTSPGTAFLSEVHERNGCRRASEAMHLLHEEMEPLADAIRDAEITSIAGLRAKALVAIWDSLPGTADHDGDFSLEDERSYESLFNGAIAIAGLSNLADAIQEELRIDASATREGEQA